MRIAYLSTFYPFRGGIRQFNENLCKAFQEQGHEVHAFTFTRQYPALFFPGTTQYAQEAQDPSGLNAEQKLDSINPLSWKTTAKKIARLEPDVLVMKFWLPFFGPSLGYVAGQLKKQGCRVLVILDNAKPHELRPGDRLFTKYLMKRSSGFIAMSDTVERDLLDIYPEADYLRLVHPLYDHYGEPIDKTLARANYDLPKDKKILLYFGFIREYKGVDVLIQAMDQLSEDYFLVIAGEPYLDWNPYKKMIGANSNAERIRPLVRYIEGSEIAPLFSATDSLILPYKNATQSGVLAMAAHYELPVVATEVGSLPEMIDTLKCGTTCPPNDASALAFKIKQFFETGKRETAIKGIQKAKSTYTWKYFAQGLVDFAKRLEE